MTVDTDATLAVFTAADAETLCVISVRRQLRSVSDYGLLSRREKLCDTGFSGVCQRIASVDKDDCKKPLNLAVLDEKLSQPLTLQVSCVISVRRRLLSIGDVGVWAGIEKLPLPPIIKDRLKLLTW